MTDVSSRLSPVHKGYREKKARLLLAKIKRGELSPQSEATVRRDYKKEFKKLESKA